MGRGRVRLLPPVGDGAVVASIILAAALSLTDQKWAFARANPCPTTGYKRYYGCPGYVLMYPDCEPVAASMRWIPGSTTATVEYAAKAKTYCTCKSNGGWGVVMGSTSRYAYQVHVKCLEPK